MSTSSEWPPSSTRFLLLFCFSNRSPFQIWFYTRLLLKASVMDSIMRGVYRQEGKLPSSYYQTWLTYSQRQEHSQMSLHSILHVKLLRNVAIHRQRQEKILFWRSDNAPKKKTLSPHSRHASYDAAEKRKTKYLETEKQRKVEKWEWQMVRQDRPSSQNGVRNSLSYFILFLMWKMESPVTDQCGRQHWLNTVCIWPTSNAWKNNQGKEEKKRKDRPCPQFFWIFQLFFPNTDKNELPMDLSQSSFYDWSDRGPRFQWIAFLHASQYFRPEETLQAAWTFFRRQSLIFSLFEYLKNN